MKRWARVKVALAVSAVGILVSIVLALAGRGNAALVVLAGAVAFVVLGMLIRGRNLARRLARAERRISTNKKDLERKIRRGSVDGTRGTPGATASTVAYGRGAAPEVSRRDRTELLAELFRTWAHDPEDVDVVGIMTPALETHLAQDFTTRALAPGMAVPMMMLSRARTFVIDELALREGPWAGADNTVGTDLLEELRECREIAVRKGMVVVGANLGAVLDTQTAHVRKLYDLSFPGGEVDLELEGIPASGLMTRLVAAFGKAH